MNGYQFLRKTPELVEQRRIALDRYANLAQISQLTVHLIIPVCAKLVASVQARNVAKKSHPNQKGSAGMLMRTARSLKCALGTEVIKGYGTYGQWTFGIAWTAWLAFLCITETAPDYLHLTKRFGLVAASQLPVHYLLAATRRLLPRSSSKLNMALHEVTGKIIIAFFAAHISLYSICFVKMGIFWASVGSLKIVVAIVSAGILFTVGVTATQFFRRRHYWWFYRVHVVGSALVLPLLFFHVDHIRPYMLESAVVLGMNAVLRTFNARKFNQQRKGTWRNPSTEH